MLNCSAFTQHVKKQKKMNPSLFLTYYLHLLLLGEENWKGETDKGLGLSAEFILLVGFMERSDVPSFYVKWRMKCSFLS